MDRTRIAGIVAAVGAAGGALFAAMEIVSPTEVTLAGGLRNSLFHLAAVVGLAALMLQGAAGRGWAGRIGVGASMVGFVLLCVAEVTDPFDTATAEVIYQACPLIIGIGMIVAGVAVLRERRWTSWRRIVPLLCGAWVFVGFLPLVAVLGDNPGLWLGLTGWELTLLALGVAVAVEAPARQPVTGTRVA